MIIKSIKEFEKLNAFNKGYFVFMFGGRNDEPHIPKVYRSTKKERDGFLRGAYYATVIFQRNLFEEQGE